MSDPHHGPLSDLGAHHTDMHLDTLDMYIYFSTHSSHRHLNSILNPNFNLHTNIATTISDEFLQFLDRIFSHFYDFWIV